VRRGQAREACSFSRSKRLVPGVAGRSARGDNGHKPVMGTTSPCAKNGARSGTGPATRSARRRKSCTRCAHSPSRPCPSATGLSACSINRKAWATWPSPPGRATGAATRQATPGATPRSTPALVQALHEIQVREQLAHSVHIGLVAWGEDHRTDEFHAGRITGHELFPERSLAR
jgi:hypothetical protein